jgi:photosystem II stability/assembly factor-like uncharacterized protein
MTRNINPLVLARVALLLVTVLIFSSCLKDDDDEVVYPGDAAIIAFSLSDFKCYHTTKSSTGADSTYATTVTGSTYKFYIDQVNRVIYNADSLPYGTKVSNLLCNVSSKNSSTVVIKSMTSDSLRYYSSSDSIDFTAPRQFSAYSLDGTTHVDYTVTVNVHKEEADSFKWSRLPSTEAFSQAQAMRMVSFNDRMYVMVSNGAQSTLYHCGQGGNEEWEIANHVLSTPFPATATDNFVATDEAMYFLADGVLLKSTDANGWTIVSQPQVRQLVAADACTLYALGNDGQLLSSRDDGRTWTAETLDSDPSLLPAEHISYCRVPSRVNDSTETVVLVGSRRVADYYGDTYSVVWDKVSEHARQSHQNAWMYVSLNDLPAYALPRLSGLTITAFNGGVVAMGGPGVGACSTEGFARFYNSTDGGVYWLSNSNIPMPSGFAANGAFAMATDGNQCLWLVCGGSGQVWRGRQPGSDWSKNQTIFTE